MKKYLSDNEEDTGEQRQNLTVYIILSAQSLQSSIIIIHGK